MNKTFSLRLLGWRDGLQKVALAQLLRNEGGLALSSAKACVDDILEGKIAIVPGLSKELAHQLAHKASNLGALCDIIQD